MKKAIQIISIISILFIVTGCIYTDKLEKDKNVDESEGEDVELVTSINVIIDGKEYVAKLEDNETVRAFISELPQSYNMSELNGNEKYVYMDNSLPTNSSNLKHILKGDIMLYGDDCLVIFYKSFDTSYSYTKIGHIENLTDLGSDNITVKFEK